MCEIEVGTKDAKTGEIKMLPKLVPACQTPAKEGTVLVTDSPKVKEHQRMVMEYLLINHPLDCPSATRRAMRPAGLQLRVRPGQSPLRRASDRQPPQGGLRRDPAEPGPVHHVHPLRPVHPRDHADRPSSWSCGGATTPRSTSSPATPPTTRSRGTSSTSAPVGALLDKDFLHKQRVWFLSKHDSLCTRCSTGCNVSAEENRGQLWRYKPRFNPHVNDYWICDEGRRSYKHANDPNLLGAMYVRRQDDLQPVPVDEALGAVAGGLARLAEGGAGGWPACSRRS
jgi:NADH-quinone oxidoreductase subunit G